MQNPDYDSDMFQSPELCTSFDGMDRHVQEFDKENKVILKAPNDSSQRFRCPSGLMEDYLHTISNHSVDVDRYTVLEDGSLFGEDVGFVKHGELHQGNYTWQSENYCVGLADMDANYNFDGEMQLTYITCFEHNETKSTAETFQDKFYPIGIAVSILFILLTLGFHLLASKKTLNNLSCWMTAAFLINMAIAYIFR